MKKPQIKNWPKYLTTFRKVHGLSQAELADDIGTNVRNIENWEQGVSLPASSMRGTLYKALKSRETAVKSHPKNSY